MKPIIKELGKVCVTPKGEWDIDKSYENIDLVYNVADGKSYISKKDVPAGIDINNTEYWVLFAESKSGGIVELPIADINILGGVKVGTYLEDNHVPIANNSKGRIGLNISDEFYNKDGNLALNKDKVNTIVGEATSSKYGIVKLGTDTGGYLPIGNIEDNPNNGLGIKLGTVSNNFNVAPLVLGTETSGVKWNSILSKYLLGIPIDTKYFDITPDGLSLKEVNAGDSATKITWDATSDMNNFKTPGIYDIYGERTRQDDNLPILNASSGHSIAARLTVVASTLQPANNEICVTQFLMLSNRRGGEGNMYVRTYNENNSPSISGWTPWQKLQGIREGYIFTDSAQINSDNQVQFIEGVTGVNNMIDNGLYSGIYTDDGYYDGRPTFLETFTLIVINNYAVVGQNSELKRTISQLKYAVDAITNQASIKIRTKTDGDTSWSDWTDIGGGISEVDITDAVKAYGLPTLITQGLAKEGVTYKVSSKNNGDFSWLEKLDVNGKIYGKLQTTAGGADSKMICLVKIISEIVVVEIYQRCLYNEYTDSAYLQYHKFIMDISCTTVKVSADMTEL